MGEHSKSLKVLVILIIVFILLGLLYWALAPGSTNETTNTRGSSSQFSPFDRSVQPNQGIEVQNNNQPYTQETPQYQPAQSAPANNEQSQTIVTQQPASSNFYSNDAQSFALPTQYSRQSTTQYSGNRETGYVYSPIYPATRPYSSYATGTASCTTCSSSGGQNNGGGMSFAELDKQVFGYSTGLNWTSKLGDTGEQIFDALYGTTPGGMTESTIGKWLPGANGGGGNGGAGAGAAAGGMMAGGMGGGGLLNFGGPVSRVTYCTCSNAVMLDISDVRGQMLSLIYQNGVSKLYANYNVYGTGQNVLGTYSSGGICMVYHGEECDSEGSPQGTIFEIGTSAQ